MSRRYYSMNKGMHSVWISKPTIQKIHTKRKAKSSSKSGFGSLLGKCHAIVVILGLLIIFYLLVQGSNTSPLLKWFKGYLNSKNFTRFEEKSENSASTGKLDTAAAYKVGNSEGYKEVSKMLQKSMNINADPCNNFHEFVCGNWEKNHPMPGHRSYYSNFVTLGERMREQQRAGFESKKKYNSKSIEMVKSFYNKCIDLESIDRDAPKYLFEKLKTFGYFPMLQEDDWNPDNFNLTKLMMIIGKENRWKSLFDVKVSTDQLNSSQTMIRFDEGWLSFVNRAQYLEPTKDEQRINAYKEYMFKLIQLFSKNNFDESKTRLEVEEVFSFETELANISLSNSERVRPGAYVPMALSNISEIMPLVDWGRFLKFLTPKTVHNYLRSNPTVVVNWEYFKRLTNLLNRTEPRIITNFVLLRHVDSLELGTEFAKINQDYFEKTAGITVKKPRWLECVIKTTSIAKYAGSSLYIQEQMKELPKETTAKMIEHLRRQIIKVLQTTEWMDEQTRQHAILKANNMKANIAYPDWILDSEKLDEYYKDLNMLPTDSFLKMDEKHQSWLLNNRFERLLKPTDSSTTWSAAAVANAYYFHSDNLIVLPAGLLQPPFFHPSYPKAFNYGSLGSIIGHEITHGFDDKGRTYDAFGNKRNWWGNETLEQFNERTTCMAEQYGQIMVEQVGKKINGYLTLGENIADNGGIMEAYQAYQMFLSEHGSEKRIPGFEQFDNNQMFFVAYGQSWCATSKDKRLANALMFDPHAPAEQRVNVVLQNQPEFSAAFNCPANSRMNPKEKCSVW